MGGLHVKQGQGNAHAWTNISSVDVPDISKDNVYDVVFANEDGAVLTNKCRLCISGKEQKQWPVDVDQCRIHTLTHFTTSLY